MLLINGVAQRGRECHCLRLSWRKSRVSKRVILCFDGEWNCPPGPGVWSFSSPHSLKQPESGAQPDSPSSTNVFDSINRFFLAQAMGGYSRNGMTPVLTCRGSIDSARGRLGMDWIESFSRAMPTLRQHMILVTNYICTGSAGGLYRSLPHRVTHARWASVSSVA